jgi:hypothetical protein
MNVTSLLATLSIRLRRDRLDGALRDPGVASRVWSTGLANACWFARTTLLMPGTDSWLLARRSAIAEGHLGQDPRGQAHSDAWPAQYPPADRRWRNPQGQAYAPERVCVTFVPSAAGQRDHCGELHPIQNTASPRPARISPAPPSHRSPRNHPTHSSAWSVNHGAQRPSWFAVVFRSPRSAFRAVRGYKRATAGPSGLSAGVAGWL